MCTPQGPPRATLGEILFIFSNVFFHFPEGGPRGILAEGEIERNRKNA